MTTRRDWARGLLDIIAGRETDGYVELRMPKKRTPQVWVPVDDLDAAVEAAMVRCLEPGADVYVGAAPRTERAGGQKAVRHTWALFADFDGNVDRALDYRHPPTAIVASGSANSGHAWWSLAEPLERRWIVQAEKRLVAHAGADMAVTDVARILRVPGTLNHKTKPPHVVRLLDYHPGRVYAIRELVSDLPDPEPVRPPSVEHVRPPIGRQPLRDIPADVYYERLTGQPARIGRHVKCPLHEDWAPSMMLYRDGSWYCFQCRHGGTIYDLAARMWNMSTHGTEFIDLKDRLREVCGL